jgi:GGDEF domain-containing protein
MLKGGRCGAYREGNRSRRDEPAFSIEGSEEIRIAATAGMALFPEDGADADTLFRNAEIVLRRAKISGDKYLFYASQMNSTSQR